mmetsp:Transcript_25125/g.63811  ORF Transcript_25125/g.63811 Transcript_25125/m.63811 type:complete len:388 (-) Transcript_25125:1327-2490(-)
MKSSSNTLSDSYFAAIPARSCSSTCRLARSSSASNAAAAVASPRLGRARDDERSSAAAEADAPREREEGRVACASSLRDALMASLACVRSTRRLAASLIAPATCDDASAARASALDNCCCSRVVDAPSSRSVCSACARRASNEPSCAESSADRAVTKIFSDRTSPTSAAARSEARRASSLYLSVRASCAASSASSSPIVFAFMSFEDIKRRETAANASSCSRCVSMASAAARRRTVSPSRRAAPSSASSSAARDASRSLAWRVSSSSRCNRDWCRLASANWDRRPARSCSNPSTFRLATAPSALAAAAVSSLSRSEFKTRVIRSSNILGVLKPPPPPMPKVAGVIITLPEGCTPPGVISRPPPNRAAPPIESLRRSVSFSRLLRSRR